MNTLFHYPHGLIRRNLSRVERIFVALGLVGLLYSLMTAVPAYPEFWDIVIILAVFLVTLYSPATGYLISVAAAAYPIFTLSVYLFVLFVAVTLLLHQVLIQNLGGAVLVALTPVLTRYNLVWGVPLLGGLWWGSSGGSWIGALAALWGMTIAGMSGLSPDWLQLMGASPDGASIVARFGNANSLKTLLLLLEPLAPNSTALLYHLLQIALWAGVAAFVGILADRPEMLRRRPWGSVLAAMSGALLLLGIHVILGLWLKQQNTDSLLMVWPTLVAAAAMAAFLVGAAETLRDFFEHPLPPFKTSQWSRPTNPSVTSFAETQPQQLPTLHQPSQTPSKQTSDEVDDPDDLIMLELD